MAYINNNNNTTSSAAAQLKPCSEHNLLIVELWSW